MNQTIINHCQKIPGLQAIYIFGSAVNNTQHNASDIDIAFVANNPMDNLERWQLAQEIAIELNKDIDLLDLNNCSEVLRFMAISTGELIFYKDKQFIEYFADKAYYLYMDLQELTAQQHLDISKEKTIYG